MLVDAGDRQHDLSMVPFQSAQRRALYQLSELGVPWGAGSELRFAYRSKSAGDDAVIGHRSGEITLDLDEADPARRERIRATLGEHYRTPLGHIRHELGHFVWLKLVASDPIRLAEFRELFGDERARLRRRRSTPTTAASTTAAGGDDHASFYASAHPWEDFAESWAQLMHVHDVVETGSEWGVVQAPDDRTDAARVAGDVDHGQRRRQRAGPGDGHARPVPVRPDRRGAGQGRVLLAACSPSASAERRQLALGRDSSTQNDRLGSPTGAVGVDGVQRHAHPGGAREHGEARVAETSLVARHLRRRPALTHRRSRRRPATSEWITITAHLPG